jgi:hypothetical protein
VFVIEPEEGCNKFLLNVGEFCHFDTLRYIEDATMNINHSENPESHVDIFKGNTVVILKHYFKIGIQLI